MLGQIGGRSRVSSLSRQHQQRLVLCWGNPLEMGWVCWHGALRLHLRKEATWYYVRDELELMQVFGGYLL